MLIDCHTHTTRYSACSRMSPDELCRTALEQGLDGLVLTEHRRFWPRAELDELRRGHPGLAIYSGIEISLLEGYDVVSVGGGDQLRDIGSMDLAGLLRALGRAREEVFLFVAHPFRFDPRWTPELHDVLGAVDGLEMNSVNILRNNEARMNGRFRPVDEDRYAAARDRYGLRELFNTDAHHALSVGAMANRIEAPAPPADELELAALLKKIPATEFQNPERMDACLEIFR